MRIKLSCPLTLREIASVLNNSLKRTDALIEYICTDTRELSRGDLFFALMGENRNGEDYVKEARAKGAYVISKSDADISVSDGTNALLLLASYYKSKLKSLLKTVAITGSVGKTTTKEILHQLLASSYRTHATEKNYNNALGVALTILSAPIDTEILVLEMGMNHRGEIEELAKAALPDIAIITNIKDAHIGKLGSREEIAKAKLEIACNEKTRLILPYDEQLFAGIFNKATVSLESPESDIYLSVLSECETNTSFDIFTSKSCIHSLKTTLVGSSYLEAIAYSVAVCELLDIRNDGISLAISKLSADIFRKRKYAFYNYTIIDDTYSASPEAVLYELKMGAKSSPCSCILGDMLELGEFAKEKHRLIGKAAFELGYRYVYAFGKYAGEIAIGATEAGMNPNKIHQNTDLSSPKNTANAIFSNVVDKETLLFKGSRMTHCERIIEHFENMVRKAYKE